MLTWSILLSSGIGALIGSGIGALIGAPLGIVLKSTVEHLLNIHRDSLAQKRLTRQKRRDETAAIVEILSEWVRPGYVGAEFNGEAKWKLQTTYWRNILLLDKKLLELLLPRLANTPDAVDTNELIVQARRVLLGLK